MESKQKVNVEIVFRTADGKVCHKTEFFNIMNTKCNSSQEFSAITFSLFNILQQYANTIQHSSRKFEN